MWARAAVTCNQRCSDTKAGRDYKGPNFSKHVWSLSRCATAPLRRRAAARAAARPSGRAGRCVSLMHRWRKETEIQRRHYAAGLFGLTREETRDSESQPAAGLLLHANNRCSRA